MSRSSTIEVLVGVLVSAAVIALGSFMVNVLSSKVGFYKRCSNITASFSNVDGIKVGSEVRVSGVNVGNVTSLQLDDDNTPVVSMCIQKNLSLPSDSSAIITYADLLGVKYIDIMPGADDSILRDGSHIVHTSTTINLQTIIDKVLNNYLK
ncbi:MAG: outer membrane lipid asymmetry maintenance protein MlaD [Aaplasma endosymbiont of Hyalomma asiaticum]